MSHRLSVTFRSFLGTAALLAFGAPVQAALYDVTVTVQNIAAANSISFARLHVGFHNGSFDAFNLGDVATTPIISVAEGGVGSAWQAAFAAADPSATRGIVGGTLFPGVSASMSFTVDSAINPFFTFASMVVPSNDFFVGNDSPTEYRLFDSAGNLSIPSITVRASDIWDAGSEIFDPAAAAFVGTGSLRRDQNSVVAFNFAELAAFNGLTTAAGYVFNSGLAADSEVYRISFGVAPVPEPATYGLMAAGLMAVGLFVRRRQTGLQEAGPAPC